MIDDLKNDPNFEMDDIENEPISEKMDIPIGLSVRFGWSSYQTAIFINSVLAVKDQIAMISRSGVDKVKKRLLQKASTRRKEESKNLFNIQFLES